MTEFEVVNVVGWISYQQELDLAALEETFLSRNEITSVTYEPAENPWLQADFAPDDTYVAFYRSGRCSITGCESVEHFESVVERVNAVMQDLLDFDYTPEHEISNIVATTSLDVCIRLEALALELGIERTEYEPEQFPALIYRGSDFVVIIFSSGNMLCTGLSDLQTISNVIDDFTERIEAVT